MVDGVRVIRTAKMTLHYRLDGGPFDASNLALRLREGETVFHPSFGGAEPGGNLGGWYRGLDNQTGPVELHDGLLSRDGWFLLDDTTSPLLTEGGRWYEPRPERSGPYQDGYLFAYGPDYVDALRDFRALAGPAPLLPRKAFGVWFSKYSFYSALDYQSLVAAFRAHDVPLDVLVVDTDFKSPNAWNGWQWTQVFSTNPEGFLRWAHAKGLDVALNVHPSISTKDPAYAAADAAAGGLDRRRRPLWRLHRGRARPVRGLGLGAARARPVLLLPARAVRAAGGRLLVARLEQRREPRRRPRADARRLDQRACTPSARATAGVAGCRCRGSAPRCPTTAPRCPGSGPSTATRSTSPATPGTRWEMLDFQSRFTAAEGAGIGHPYVSHDIGSFHAEKLSGDMYVRWVQLGAFQPILRLHSHHGRRLPWEYERRPRRIASEFLRLRESLIPYTYTLAREAYDSGLPIVRAMYLGWPKLGAAYRFDRQYMYGDSLLVAPIGTPGARKRVWFPPGEWVDIFTGQRHRGPKAKTVRAPLERMPVFARAGAIVPRQPDTSHAAQQQGEPLVLGVYGGDDGSFTLYEDAGDGLDYQGGGFARTRFAWRQGAGSASLEIGRARGAYRVPARRYELRITGVPRPRSVGGSGAGSPDWSYAPDSRQLTIVTARVAPGAAPP